MMIKNKKIIAFTLLVVFSFQLGFPTVSWALTGGPSQPEVTEFKPIGATDMVDLFTGDFSYNIPLFELPGPNGGYPFNLAYQSGITMDQEASWVGLGWSLQPGAINRQMRGVPDEFKGDEIATKMSVDPSVTVTLGVGGSVELFGKDPKVKVGDLSVGLSISKNNYRGFSYAVDGNLGYSVISKTGLTASLGLGVSVDSKEGVGVSPSLGLGSKVGTFGLQADYNSLRGLTDLSYTTSTNMQAKKWSNEKNAKENKKKTDKTKDSGIKEMEIDASASFNLINQSYTPQISMPMINVGAALTIRTGPAFWGVFPSGYIKGVYNEQKLLKDKQWVRSPSYGYLHYEDAKSNRRAVLDFNREKDGLVSKETPNLGIPSLTYDLYSVSGQGIGVSYRPMRNDYGTVYDQEVKSTSQFVGLGVDASNAHGGPNLSVNHSRSVSGLWSDDNDMIAQVEFKGKRPNNPFYESVYWKVHGEPVVESEQKLAAVGGEKAVRVQLGGVDNSSAKATAMLERKGASPIPAPDNSTVNPERQPRNQIVDAITNGELMNAQGTEAIHYFKVNYINEAGDEQAYPRPTSEQEIHHIAGYTALTADGLRYVYGIPAYNTKQYDVTFSVQKQSGAVNRVNVTAGPQADDPSDTDPVYEASNTDKFLKHTKLPKYAHSFLLTAIVGPDYVDVTNNGVTDDDLGYWVRFTYRRTSSAYKWRDPFYQAHYNRGWETDARDDKASFVYGEKELWYLQRAETKTHVAEFVILPRHDGYGASGKFQNAGFSPTTSVATHQLDHIKLYSKFSGEQTLIKSVYFKYDNSRCPNVENSEYFQQAGQPNGKLTLTDVWFQYGNSERGKTNPYKFTYHTSNPDYSVMAYDRWGVYKPEPEPGYNIDFPYALQDPANKAEIDANAAAWSLTQIELPSGAKIFVDYESDDYAYVQNQTAMQMTPVVNPAGTGTEMTLSDSDTEVWFRLEQTIPGNLDIQQQEEIVRQYLDTRTWQLYFRFKINLKKPSQSAYEYISGYVNIDPQGMRLEKSGNDYTYGVFKVKKDGNYNPFSRMAWQHLRTNQPDLLHETMRLSAAGSTSAKVKHIMSLGPLGEQIRLMFKGFNAFCAGKQLGREILVGKSWIRLKSVDKIKFGGGARVKQITMIDGWTKSNDGVYGQIYEYTTTENGKVISSGVAANEPLAGGDENALRYAKKYTESIPLRSDNNLYFEYPVNESSYPGAQVGYSKVTVMSLAAAVRNQKAIVQHTATPVFPTGEGISFGTSGMIVHEFYTAKDFPVLTEETEKSDKMYKMSIALPLAGSKSLVKLTSSQGYTVITNDMHGRTKQVSNYRQAKSGAFEPDPISWVKYTYQHAERVVNGEKVLALNNALVADAENEYLLERVNETNSASPKYYLGQESEFFYDMREHVEQTWGGGANLNIDLVTVPVLGVIPIPSKWPNVSRSASVLRTAVTNKVIFRSGILIRTEAFDGGSLIRTDNLKWDKQTGGVVLTSVNNNFDDLVYQYNIPGFREYAGMGAAYQNIGLTFQMTNLQRDPYQPELYTFEHALGEDKLMPGDEILLYTSNNYTTPVGRIVYTGIREGEEVLYSEQTLSETSYYARIYRSGYRNQISVSAGAITALEDPSHKGPVTTYTKTISVPK